jgi:HEAT repeat protein
MALDFEHEQVRTTEDRSRTSALLDAVCSTSTSDVERADAFQTLAFLEDYRSIEPLTAIVENQKLRPSVRQGASDVLAGFDDRTSGDRRRGWWGSGDPIRMAHALRLMERSEADIVAAVAGDDAHPLQRFALAAMALGFDEAEFQPVKIRALEHPDAEVRTAAADVLLWDEPVEAEAQLVTAATDRSDAVAAAAVNTLQYYPSRRVLRILSELAQSGVGELRAKAAESLDYDRGRFEYCAASGDRQQVARLREWMEPVADIVRWSDEVDDRETSSPPKAHSRSTLPAHALMVLLSDPDGEWASTKQVLREVDWAAYSLDERNGLCETLVTHPDPVAREIGALPLAAWSRTEELLALVSDPSFSVRKSAIYHLRGVPRDPEVAVLAWEYLHGGCGATASEALQTYVAHGSVDDVKERLVGLGRIDRRENVRTTAISCLTDLAAAPELETLITVLREVPGVSWAVHIQLINGLRELGLPAPDLDDLAAVDNLDLFQSIVALACSSGR